eukprot:10538038-Alexandrium_andersonii.AAC.1
MSASLVGSEMCIRDRTGTSGAPEAPIGGVRGAVAPPERPLAPEEPAWGSGGTADTPEGLHQE